MSSQSDSAKAKVQHQFGASSEAYASSEVHSQGESLGLLMEHLPVQKTDVLLDVATGAGHTAVAFANKLQRVVAGDITDQMLQTTERLARERGVTNLETKNADAERLPFKDVEFDLVTCRLAFHHFPEPERAMQEFSRVLKPGGWLGFTDNFAVENQDDAAFYNRFERVRDPSHVEVYSLNRLSKFFADAGFNVQTQKMISKEFEFVEWADRQNVNEDDRKYLLDMARDVPESLVDSFRPRFADGTFYFTLWETVVVAQRN